MYTERKATTNGVMKMATSAQCLFFLLFFVAVHVRSTAIMNIMIHPTMVVMIIIISVVDSSSAAIKWMLNIWKRILDCQHAICLLLLLFFSFGQLARSFCYVRIKSIGVQFSHIQQLKFAY